MENKTEGKLEEALQSLLPDILVHDLNVKARIQAEIAKGGDLDSMVNNLVDYFLSHDGQPYPTKPPDPQPSSNVGLNKLKATLKQMFPSTRMSSISFVTDSF